MTDTQIEVVCDEALSCALLPLARRSLEPLLSSMCRKALALHKEGLLPEVPKGVVLALVTDREMADLNRSARHPWIIWCAFLPMAWPMSAAWTTESTCGAARKR